MNQNPKRWLHSSLMGLGLIGFVANGQAATLDLGTFDTTAQVNGAGGGYQPHITWSAMNPTVSGTLYTINTLGWDSTQDNTGNGGGSCKISVNFANGDPYGDAVRLYGLVQGTPYYDSTPCAVTNFIATNYVSVDFDILWDTNNSTLSLHDFNYPPNGGSPGLQINLITTNYRNNYTWYQLGPMVVLPNAASNGWVHVSMPITNTAAVISTRAQGIGFYKYNSAATIAAGGTADFWIDNVTFKSAGAPPAILDSDNFESYPLAQDMTTGGYGWSLGWNSGPPVVWSNPTIANSTGTNQYLTVAVDSSANGGGWFGGEIKSKVRPMPAGISANLANINFTLDVLETGLLGYITTATVRIELQSIAADGYTVTGDSDLNVALANNGHLTTIGGVLTNFSAITSPSGPLFNPASPNYRYVLWVDEGWKFAGTDAIQIDNMIMSNPNAQSAGLPPKFTAGGISLLPGGTVSLTATGAVGVAYSLWAGTNLVATPITNTWSKLTNGTIGTSPFTLQLPGAGNHPQQFFLFTSP